MRGHEGFLETTIAGPSAMHCHCQATQETENVGNLIRCMAMPSFVHMQRTHTYRKISVEHLQLGSVSQTQVCTNIFNCEPLKRE